MKNYILFIRKKKSLEKTAGYRRRIFAEFYYKQKRRMNKNVNQLKKKIFFHDSKINTKFQDTPEKNQLFTVRQQYLLVK